jgi:hypothetical protein
MKSIALSNSGFVFDGYFENELIDFLMPDGTTSALEVPVIDEVGLLATKSKSCTQRSRPRDIFDIYLAIAYPRCPTRFKQQLERLRERHNNVYASLECIGRALDDWEGEFGPPEVFAKCNVDFADAVKVMRSFLVELDFPGSKLSGAFDIAEP